MTAKTLRKYQYTSVTWGTFNVSSTSPGRGGTGATLNVSRWPKGIDGKYVKADEDGRAFPSSEAAHAFALERGYAQRAYRRVWCRACRVLHTFLGRPTPTCFKALGIKDHVDEPVRHERPAYAREKEVRA